MEEKRKEELTKFFTVSSAVLSVLYAACILLSLLAPLLPKFIPLLAFFLFFAPCWAPFLTHFILRSAAPLTTISWGSSRLSEKVSPL